MIFPTKLPKALFFFLFQEHKLLSFPKGESGSVSDDSLCDTTNERWTDIFPSLRLLMLFVADSPVTVTKQEGGTVRGKRTDEGRICRRGNFTTLATAPFGRSDLTGPRFCVLGCIIKFGFTHTRLVWVETNAWKRFKCVEQIKLKPQ